MNIEGLVLGKVKMGKNAFIIRPPMNHTLAFGKEIRQAEVGI